MILRLLLCLIAVAGLTGVCGCDGRTQIEGTVVHSDETPIEGAKVSLEDLTDTIASPAMRLTDERGRFSVGKTHAPVSIKLKFTVEKDGFVSHSETFNSTASTRPRRIILAPIEK